MVFVPSKRVMWQMRRKSLGARQPHAGAAISLCGLVLLVVLGLAARATSTATDPYEILRQAYLRGDAQQAAAAYSQDATYVEMYSRTKPAVRQGQAAIRQGFVELFEQLKNDDLRSTTDLNFRILESFMLPSGRVDSGYYRLRVGDPKDPMRFVSYGAFSARIQDNRFVFDTNRDATLRDFESAPGKLMFDADEEMLEARYYDNLTGIYLDERGCHFLVSRSTRSLFALDECSRQWRRLQRVSGLRWTAGNNVLGSEPSSTLEFNLPVDGAASELLWKDKDTNKRTHKRTNQFSTELVAFESEKQRLSGTMYIPVSAATSALPAVVLLHGSGPQDRQGYASYIQILAMHAARRGFIALAFDKRGTGSSDGNWESATFDDLANDVIAALRYLKSRPEVDSQRVGLLGSSQAGWVAANAIRKGADPNNVVLIGAAGAAVTVQEQNLYNTEVRMRCRGIAAHDIKLAIEQQRVFFAAKRDAAQANRLGELTRRGLSRPAVRDWLFPGSVTPETRLEWYDVLDVDFDPMPVWREYKGGLHVILGELDDSTPTRAVSRKLKTLQRRSSVSVTVLPATQHLGLIATDVCRADLEYISQFHPAFFSAVDGALQSPFVVNSSTTKLTK